MLSHTLCNDTMSSEQYSTREEEEILRVQLEGTSQNISLHQYAQQELHNYSSNAPSTLISGTSSTTSVFSHIRNASRIPADTSIEPGPFPQTRSAYGEDGTASKNNSHQAPAAPPSSASDSPFFRRRFDSFCRTSTEFTIPNFKTGPPSSSYTNVVSGSSSNSDFDNEFGESPFETLAVKASASSESQALYGPENRVTELKPEYIRWMYKYEQDGKWTPFKGNDSMRMELSFRDMMLEKGIDGPPDVGDCPHYFTTINIGDGYYNRNGNNGQAFQPGYNYPPQCTVYNGPQHSDLQQNQHYYSHPHQATYTQTSNCFTSLDNSHQDQDFQYDQQSHHGYMHGEPCSSSYHYSSTQPQPWQSQPMPQQTTFNNFSNSDPLRLLAHDLNPVPEPAKEDDVNRGPWVIVVRGGLYEADLEHAVCTATYWPDDKCQITRGLWFYDGTWQPLMPLAHAERLEVEHLGHFSGFSLLAYAPSGTQIDSPTRRHRPVIHRVQFDEYTVDWTSPIDVHLYSKAASYKFMRSVGIRLGFPATWGVRLCRGYYRPALMEDKPSDINHLVFVIHGIGQKMDTGRIVRNCTSFRECVSSLKEKFLPQLNDTKPRAEFFPVEWRSNCNLDGEIVDAITPHKLLSLRQLLNSTAMDIMYYTSPLYRTEIQNALKKELNRTYYNFVRRNPDFKSRGGKVSVLAHSLGAVITYDIVTGYRPHTPELPPFAQFGSPAELALPALSDNFIEGPTETAAGLYFHLEHFFCVGSPLSVFLALRWKEPHNPLCRPYILPNVLCKRIYNVFYSTDPVAYRLEPLLNKEYIQIAPLCIHTYGTIGTDYVRYDDMPRERIDKEPSSNTNKPQEAGVTGMTQTQQSSSYPNGFIPQESAKSTPQKGAMKSPPSPTKDSWGWTSLIKYLNRSEPGMPEGENGIVSPEGNSTPSREEGNSSPDDVNKEILNDIPYRMDYVLRESNFSSTYLAALTSHTSYWTSPDTAYFVLAHLYDDAMDSQSPNSQTQPTSSSP